MSINRYNHENYIDPTAYEALTKIERKEKADKKSAYKPLVYICSPFSGDVEKNTQNVRRFCRYAVRQNVIPIAMHLLLPQFMDDNNPYERKMAMFMNMVVLGKCSAVWVFGSNISEGMSAEIKKAKEYRKVIRYFDENCKEVKYV